MKDIQTVTGALDPSLLGFTLMHEHLLISSWNNRITDPEWLPYEKALDFIAPVIADAKAAGGQINGSAFRSPAFGVERAKKEAAA